MFPYAGVTVSVPPTGAVVDQNQEQPPVQASASNEALEDTLSQDLSREPSPIPKRRPGRPRKNSPLPPQSTLPTLPQSPSQPYDEDEVSQMLSDYQQTEELQRQQQEQQGEEEGEEGKEEQEDQQVQELKQLELEREQPEAGPSGNRLVPVKWDDSEASSEGDDLDDASYGARSKTAGRARGRGRGSGRGRGGRRTRGASIGPSRLREGTPINQQDTLSVPLASSTKSRSRSPSVGSASREPSPSPAPDGDKPSALSRFLADRKERSPSVASAPAPLEGLGHEVSSSKKRRRMGHDAASTLSNAENGEHSDSSSELSSPPAEADRGHVASVKKKQRRVSPSTDEASPAFMPATVPYHTSGFGGRRKVILQPTSDSEASESSAPRASSLPLRGGKSRGRFASGRQSREQTRAENESKRQQALATVMYEQDLLHKGRHPYCNQLIATIEDERRLRIEYAQRLLNFNLNEVDVLCHASSHAAIQQWRDSARAIREGYIDEVSKQQRAIQNEYLDPYLEHLPYYAPPPIQPMHLPNSQVPWDRGLGRYPEALSSADVAQDFAYMGFTVVTGDEEVLAKLEELSKLQAPPPEVTADVTTALTPGLTTSAPSTTEVSRAPFQLSAPPSAAPVPISTPKTEAPSTGSQIPKRERPPAQAPSVAGPSSRPSVAPQVKQEEVPKPLPSMLPPTPKMSSGPQQQPSHHHQSSSYQGQPHRPDPVLQRSGNPPSAGKMHSSPNSSSGSVYNVQSGGRSNHVDQMQSRPAQHGYPQGVQDPLSRSVTKRQASEQQTAHHVNHYHQPYRTDRFPSDAPAVVYPPLGQHHQAGPPATRPPPTSLLDAHHSRATAPQQPPQQSTGPSSHDRIVFQAENAMPPMRTPSQAFGHGQAYVKLPPISSLQGPPPPSIT